MGLGDRLRRLISGAHSSTGARVEQSEYSRRTVRSVEVTVETDEVIFARGAKSRPGRPKVVNRLQLSENRPAPEQREAELKKQENSFDT